MKSQNQFCGPWPLNNYGIHLLVAKHTELHAAAEDKKTTDSRETRDAGILRRWGELIKLPTVLTPVILHITYYTNTVHLVPKCPIGYALKTVLKYSFPLNPVIRISILMYHIFRDAFKYSIKTDSLSNNIKSAKVIANISALSLHHSYVKPLIPPSFLSNSGTCNHSNIP